MIQFHILSGNQAGHVTEVRRFPFVVGRNDDAGLRLDDPGVWEQHLEVDFERTGFSFSARGEALALVNGERVESGYLRNGDVIDLGSARLQFWLARTRQESLRWRETLTWIGLLAILAGQAGLILWLMR